MKYTYLGQSGLQVSQLGLGTNSFGKRADEQTSARILHHAIDHGINFIDTANIYAGTESERIIGQALQGKRDQVVLATKAGLVKDDKPNGRGASRYHLQLELENSLRRLQTDYVDLYQIHTFDPNTPLEETLRALDDMVRSGKVRYIGASNYAAWEIMKALGISEMRNYVRYVSTQTSYSLADRTPELELVPMCLDQGVGIIPYFPLAGGILTGKYTSKHSAPSGSRAETDPNFNRFLEEHNLELGRKVSALAASHGYSPSALSVAWLMNRPAVSTVIVGATKTEQLDDNIKSLEIDMNSDLGAELNQISEPFIHAKPFATYRI